MSSVFSLSVVQFAYFLCGAICCCIPHSKHDDKTDAPSAAAGPANAADTVTVEKTVNADGTTVTKTTTTHPDGSKTVEEVVEAPEVPLVPATVGDEKV